MADTTRFVLLFTLALFGTSLAIDCETGEFESNSVCVECSAGYYNNATAQTDCNDECPTGTWSAAGASSCTDCIEGYTQLDFSTANDDASTCETGCDSGYSYDDSSSTCKLCAAGYYSSNTTAASSTSVGCIECDTGYTTSGTTAASGCTLCAAGFGNTDCAACPSGMSSENLNDPNSDECTLCGDDTGCNSQGTCLSSGSCECDAEYSGTYCATAYDDCDLDLCGDGGTCADATRTVSGTFAYTCTCTAGYTLDETTANMPTCTKDLPCASVTCSNPDGFCYNYNDEAKCGYQDPNDSSIFTCDTGYEGDLCATETDNCDPDPCDTDGSSACTSSVGAFACTCNTDYRGSTCAQPPQYITTVTASINITIDGLTEVVFDGMASLEDTIEQATIDKEIADYIDDSFTGYTATYSANVDSTDPAVAGILIGFEFQITSTTSGSRRRKRRSLTAAENTALTSSLGEIASDPSITSVAASESGLTVTPPTAAATRATKAADVDACVNNPCENGGTCTDSTGTDDTTNGRTCACVTGFEGDSCETNIDDCAIAPCENGFTCTDGTNNYACDCSASSLWSGKDCGTDNFCAQTTPCNGHGTCADAACTCDIDTDSAGNAFLWAGTQCTYKDYCTYSSCPTESTCVGTQTSSACNCNLGYGPAWVSGESGSCETYACTGFCSNSGTCSINGTSGAAECACPAGYSGTTCEQSVCDGYNCNNGSCKVENGAAMCMCNVDWTGASCDETDHCVGNACTSDSTCVSQSSGGYFCDCNAGFVGVLCEISTTEAPVDTTTVSTEAPVETTTETPSASFVVEISLMLVLVVSLLM